MHLRATPWAQGLRLEHDRDRPVVDELEVHARAEDSAGHAHALRLERGAEPLVEWLGALRRGGLGKARAIPLGRVLKLSDVNWKMESR